MVNAPEWLNIFTQLHTQIGSDDFLYNIRPKSNDIATSKRGAVLILLHDGARSPEVLITLRSAELRSHSGQPSFPGGALEIDESARDAALRESEEEVGIKRESIELLFELPELFIPPSNFLVTPILGYWRDPHKLTPQVSSEVVRAEFISLEELAHPTNRIMLRHRNGYRGPAFDVAGMRIWGFTGGILDRLIYHAGFEQEWNREKTVELEL
jgi:8-oxo-dGTP pyrophosphatase MutT (NUDIX family)